MNTASAIYTELRQRYEFASLAQRSSLPDVQILDNAAVSQLPRTADRRAAVAIALFLLLVGAGMGGAVFADRMDPHMRTPDEVATVLGLTVLGVVPRIRPGADKEESMDQAREAFRSLVVSVQGIATLAIWTAIFTPFWLPFVVFLVWAVRRSNRIRATTMPPGPGATGSQAG